MQIARSRLTTIRDVGGTDAIPTDLRDAIAAGKDSGSDGCAPPGALLCMTGGHGWWIGRAVDAPLGRAQSRARADAAPAPIASS